jgi:hypothetical protein
MLCMSRNVFTTLDSFVVFTARDPLEWIAYIPGYDLRADMRDRDQDFTIWSMRLGSCLSGEPKMDVLDRIC